jgi:hypothetical protein
MLHPLEQVRDHQNPLADTPALASCQAPQLGRPRFAAKKVCRHRPSPKHGTLPYSLYHIWGSPEAGIIELAFDTERPCVAHPLTFIKLICWRARKTTLSPALISPDTVHKRKATLSGSMRAVLQNVSSPN